MNKTDQGSDIENKLTQAILKSIDKNEFKWDKFFQIWFRDHGHSYYFMFKKNLSVTNIQYAELFSLLSIHSASLLQEKQPTKLLCYSTEHIKNTFTEAINSLLDTSEDLNKVVSEFSSRYISIYASTVAVDLFYNSCAVFIPPGISLHLDKILFDSGYIHSAGKSVFIRNIKKARKSEFYEALNGHLKKNVRSNVKTPFIVYSHEDFSSYDKQYSEQIHKGIDQCKLYVEKMSMGRYRLSSILNELGNKTEWSSLLEVPKPGSYLEYHQFQAESTLWLVMDKSISLGQVNYPGQSRYYICYEQLYKDDCPFFIFDENKPAWKSHTTLPHSLTASLINIARLHLNNGLIVDPFGGTGTTWLEVKRLGLKNSIRCSDLSHMTIQLVKDNLLFFTLPVDNLKQIALCLEQSKPSSPAKGRKNQFELSFDGESDEFLTPYSRAKELFDGLIQAQPDEEHEFDVPPEIVNNVSKSSLEARFIFYTLLRTFLRYQSGLKRNSISFEDAYVKSISTLNESIKLFIKMKTAYQGGDYDFSLPYAICRDTYSRTVVPTMIFAEYEDFITQVEGEIESSKDARILEESSIDLIVCDPPYGFNTEENPSNLAELYKTFIGKAIAALKPNGQLIMCLPAESYTGRELPYCTRSDVVSRQVAMMANELGRKIIYPAMSTPFSMFRPPFYWESDKALRRVILHYYFQ